MKQHEFGTVTVDDAGSVACKNCGFKTHYTNAYGGECRKKELTTAEKLMWLVENLSIDTGNSIQYKIIVVWKNGLSYRFGGKTFEETINQAYEWAKGIK